MSNGPALSFAADGEHLLRAASGKPALEWWSTSRKTVDKTVELQIPAKKWPLQYASFSPSAETGFGVASDGDIFVFETDSGRTLARLHGPEPPIRAGVLSKGGHWLAVSTERDSVVHLFEVTSGRSSQLAGHHDFVSGIAFAPDGALLATGSVDAAIKLWDTRTAKLLGTLTGHAEEATDLVFSPDARTLVSIGAHESVKFWHVPTRREMMSLADSRIGFHLEFSPDGRSLAICQAGEQNQSVRILKADSSDSSGFGLWSP
jgi:WD40 repeat protein